MTESIPNGRVGKQILNNVVDNTARTTPNLVYAELPRSCVDLSHGFRQVTYRDFANAINGVAWWLRKNLGHSKPSLTLVRMTSGTICYYWEQSRLATRYKLMPLTQAHIANTWLDRCFSPLPDTVVSHRST